MSLIHVSSSSTSSLHDFNAILLASGLWFHTTYLPPRSPPCLGPPPPPPARPPAPGDPGGVPPRYPRRLPPTVLGPDALQGKSRGTGEEEESVSDQVLTSVLSLSSHCPVIAY